VDWIMEIAQSVPGDGTADDKAVDYFVAELSGGKSVPEFMVQEWLEWPIFAAWLRKDVKRNARYMQALADRSALRKEKLVDLWWDTAVQEPEEAPGHGDIHKAREALAKAEGMFVDRREVEHSVGVTVEIVRFAEPLPAQAGGVIDVTPLEAAKEQVLLPVPEQERVPV
jgi:alpha-beta hydrolase superfamily lysophospholipase